ncbi:MAG: methyltransferase domain-containing protein [Desulfurococcaceae archaeon]
MGRISTADVFDALYEDYDKWYEKNRTIAEAEARLVEEMARNAPRPFIEIGVGTGFFASRVRAEIGLDPSINMLKVAKERGVENLILGVGEEVPLRNSSVGTVLLIVTLCFVDDPERVLDEAHRILRDGGSVIACIVPADSEWGAYYKELGKRGHRFYSKARFYTREEVARMLDKAGFVVVESKGVLSFSPRDTPAFEEPSDNVEGKGFVCIRAVKRSLGTQHSHQAQ